MEKQRCANQSLASAAAGEDVRVLLDVTTAAPAGPGSTAAARLPSLRTAGTEAWDTGSPWAGTREGVESHEGGHGGAALARDVEQLWERERIRLAHRRKAHLRARRLGHRIL
jgi:hypothetical protein